MRMTPQTKAVIEELEKLGHASNLELLEKLRASFPDLSATTVHRITNRLVDKRLIGSLRSPLDGATLLDANPAPHYHFACQPCGKVQDIELASEVIDALQLAVGQKIVRNTLVITGIKTTCPHYKSSYFSPTG